MFEVPDLRENHGNSVLICCSDNFFVPNGTTRLDNSFDPDASYLINTVSKWEKPITGHNTLGQLDLGLLCAQPSRVNSAHLACSDPYCLP